MEGQIIASRNPLKAEQFFKRAIDGLSQIGADSFAPINELGLLYIFYLRDIKKAIDTFQIAKQELERYGREHSMQYITVQNNLATCYQYLGLSNDAIAVFEETEETVKQYYGESHPIYGAILQSMSKFYGELLDYDRGIEYAIEAASCMRNVYGENNEKYAVCIYNLALFYGIVGRIDESIELIQHVIPVLEKSSVSNAIALYKLLYSQYSYRNNWRAFQSIVNKCAALIKNEQLQNTAVEARFLAHVGACLKERDKTEAQLYLSRAILLYENLEDVRSAEYLEALMEQALLTADSLDESIISKLIDTYKDIYFSNVIFLKAAEREHLVSSPVYSQIKNLIFTARAGKANDSLLYNYLLFTKGLLLETSINYAQSIYNSNYY